MGWIVHKEYTPVRVKVEFPVHKNIMELAVVEVMKEPGVRLSKASVTARAREFYDSYGNQADNMDSQDLNLDYPSDKQIDRARMWIEKRWPGTYPEMADD